MQVDSLLTICSIAGGSAGIIISMLLFDRKAEKGNMMSRVFVFSILIIQIVIVLVANGYHKGTFSLPIIDFFRNHMYIVWYLIIANIITFVAYGLDKLFAIEHMWRIKIVTLLTLAFFGGSIGAILAMYLFRHKINKDYFTVGIPLIILMQIVLLIYIMNVV